MDMLLCVVGYFEYFYIWVNWVINIVYFIVKCVYFFIVGIQCFGEVFQIFVFYYIKL